MKPITKEKIGWGIVGTGTIAHDFANCLSLVSDAYIAAVGSRTIESAQKFADEFGGKPYGSYEEMFQDPDVDVVYIATPHMVHEENVIMAAKYGKNILCEKPFAINRAQAERMFAAAKEAGVFIMEGLWSRFFPVWREVKKLIDSGELGQMVSIDAACCWGARRGPNGFPPTDRRVNMNLAGGALLDAGIYSLAHTSIAMDHITEIPEKIFSTMRFEESGVDSDTDILMELKDGISAHLVCSLHRRNHEVTIYFEDGSINIQNPRMPRSYKVTKRNQIPGVRWAGNNEYTYEIPFMKTGFQFEAMAVQDCLRKGLTTCPDVPPEETLALTGICDKVRYEHGFHYPFAND